MQRQERQRRHVVTLTTRPLAVEVNEDSTSSARDIKGRGEGWLEGAADESGMHAAWRGRVA